MTCQSLGDSENKVDALKFHAFQNPRSSSFSLVLRPVRHVWYARSQHRVESSALAKIGSQLLVATLIRPGSASVGDLSFRLAGDWSHYASPGPWIVRGGLSRRPYQSLCFLRQDFSFQPESTPCAKGQDLAALHLRVPKAIRQRRLRSVAAR